MNIKAFFVDALTSALELGIGTPDDVLRHVTPDVLANHLPRPLWARLLTACLGAPKVDSQLVIETVGMANLCEHVPTTIIWGCISELGARSLGKAFEAAAPSMMVSRTTQPIRGTTSSVLAPPPEPVAKPTTPAKGTPVQLGPSIPKPTPAKGNAVTAQPISGLTEGEDTQQSNTRSRSPTGQRFRQSGTGVRTLGGVARRPQAAAVPVVKPAARRIDSSDYETETAVESADWREKEIVVDDEQLVDWQADPGSAVSSAITGDDDFSDLGGRKR